MTSKVLVIEGQPSVAAMLRYHLEHVGYRGVFAPDANEAWRLLVSEAPEAAVVDVGPPAHDGWQLVERIRDDGRFHALPIVLLAGMMEAEGVRRARALQCDYLSKPFAASALVAKIDNLVARVTESEPAPGPAARAELVAVGVTLLVGGYVVEGRVHLPPEVARFSDAWEAVMRDKRSFIPVTAARVTSAATGSVVASPAFMSVRKDDLCAVFPLDIAPQ